MPAAKIEQRFVSIIRENQKFVVGQALKNLKSVCEQIDPVPQIDLRQRLKRILCSESHDNQGRLHLWIGHIAKRQFTKKTPQAAIQDVVDQFGSIHVLYVVYRDSCKRYRRVRVRRWVRLDNDRLDDAPGAELDFLTLPVAGLRNLKSGYRLSTKRRLPVWTLSPSATTSLGFMKGILAGSTPISSGSSSAASSLEGWP